MQDPSFLHDFTHCVPQENELISLARSLLLAWNDPLLLLSSEAPTLPHPSNGDISSKIRELQDYSKSLGDGLDIMVNKVGD